MKKVYTEEQKMRQVWIWAVVLGILSLFLWGIVQQIVFGKEFGNNPVSNISLVAFSLIPILLIYFLYNYIMTTEINEDCIIFKIKYFFEKRIYWSEVEKVEIIKYKPLAQFGGWGIRYGLKNMAYSVSGNHCLEISFKEDRKKILLGTQDPDRLQLFLNNINR